jgi:hypothetical protein
MHDRFRAVLSGQGVAWLELRGEQEERLTRALAAVDAMLAGGWGLADPLG